MSDEERRTGEGAPADGPPRVARLLVSWGAPTEDRELLGADLEERFRAIRRSHGSARARRWYWSQAVRGLHARLVPDLDLLGRRSWQGTLGDVRQSLRVLGRRPLYTVGVAGTLAIGLASATAVVSIAWHVWLAPMPYPDPGRVVKVFELAPPDGQAATRGDATRWLVSPPLLEDLRANEWSTVDAVVAVTPDRADWSRDGSTRLIPVLQLSPEAFAVFGMRPLVGRTLSDDVDAAEVVLSEPFWRSAYGGDVGVVGAESMLLDDEPHLIVGVVEAPTGYPRVGDVITRISWADDQLVTGMRGARYLDVIARVVPDRTVEEASAELDRFVRALGGSYAIHDGWGAEAVPLGDELIEPYRGVLGLLLAAGAIFLLLAIVNVAGLVAARTVEAGHDRAIRLALGASGSRLLRASAVESLLLGTLAAAGALSLANWLLGPIQTLVPAEVPRIGDVRLSFGVAASMAAIALASGAGVGVLAHSLARPGRPSVGRVGRVTRPGNAGRGALVASQIALTTLLATSGAGVLRHMLTLQAVDIGFEARGVVASQVSLSEQRYPTGEARLAYWRAALEAARGRGLRAAIGTNSPMSGMNMRWGWQADATADEASAQYHVVSDDYFGIMGIEILEGRPFTADDREGGEPVVIVNEALAAEAFGAESAVGRTILVLRQPRLVVGVAASTRHFGPDSDVPLEIYAPYTQDPWSHAQLFASGEPDPAGAVLADVLERLDPALGVPPPAPYARLVSGWYASLRLQAIIVGVLALVGTALATLGLYALVAYRVSTRKREIGVRLALGASDTRVFSDVVRQGVRLTSVGIVAGVAAWYASLPATGDFLGGIDAGDPWTPLAVVVAVGLVATAATAIPALRSASVDPVVALRSE